MSKMLTFPRLRSMCEDADVIMDALERSVSGLIQIDR